MRHRLYFAGLAIMLAGCAHSVAQTPPDDAATSGHDAKAGADSGADHESGGGTESGSDSEMMVGQDAGGCTPASCQKGCCNSGGECVGGTMPSACGIGGNVCVDCTQTGMGCTSAQGCGVVTCTGCTGCCSAEGMCELGVSDQACGTGGEACQDCSASELSCGNNACGE